MDNNQKSSADHIVEHLLSIDVDGETMEYIIDGTHMREQMLKQLAMKASDQDLNIIMSERDAIHDRGRNSHLTSHHKPNTMQKPISVHYLFRCDDPKRPSWMGTDVYFELSEMAKVQSTMERLDAEGVNYDLLIERFDPNTDTVLSNDYIVERNSESSVNTEQIPADQRKLIQKALTFYLETSEKIVSTPSDADEYERFDMRQLKEMMEYPINIEITPEQRAKFCANHGMDFPEYV